MKATGCRLLDSSAWLAYYFGESESTKRYVESDENLVVSMLSFFEIQRKLLKGGYSSASIEEFLGFIQSRAEVIELSFAILTEASRISVKHHLGAMDAMILSSARSSSSVLVTGDFDFKGLDNVEFIK